MVIKVSAEGDVYLDGRQVSIEEMEAAIAEVRAHEGALTYYRESPRSEPSTAANQVFRRIMDARVAIQLGHQAPSEWGRLDWVEVERAPHQSRFFMARGQPFLVAYSEGGPEPVTYVGGPMAEAAENGWLDQADLLVRSDRVLETPPHEPNLAFAPEAMKTPSIHLRVGYGERRWASRFRLDDAPSHLRSFERDLSRVAHHLVTSTDRGGWKEVGPEEIGRIF